MSSVIADNENLELPAHFEDVFYEVELGVLIGMRGRNIKSQDYMKYIAGYFIGIDFTNQGLANDFKNDGAPWSLGKSSQGFAAISDFVDRDSI